MSVAEPLVQPLDDANQRLLSAVHPEEWRNPEPQDVYDIVVVGGGTAGLVSTVGHAGILGAIAGGSK